MVHAAHAPAHLRAVVRAVRLPRPALIAEQRQPVDVAYEGGFGVEGGEARGCGERAGEDGGAVEARGRRLILVRGAPDRGGFGAPWEEVGFQQHSEEEVQVGGAHGGEEEEIECQEGSGEARTRIWVKGERGRMDEEADYVRVSSRGAKGVVEERRTAYNLYKNPCCPCCNGGENKGDKSA